MLTQYFGNYIWANEKFWAIHWTYIKFKLYIFKNYQNYLFE